MLLCRFPGVLPPHSYIFTPLKLLMQESRGSCAGNAGHTKKEPQPQAMIL